MSKLEEFFEFLEKEYNIIKQMPPGPPPAGRQHLIWKPLTHRWVLPPNYQREWLGEKLKNRKLRDIPTKELLQIRSNLNRTMGGPNSRFSGTNIAQQRERQKWLKIQGRIERILHNRKDW